MASKSRDLSRFELAPSPLARALLNCPVMKTKGLIVVVTLLISGCATTSATSSSSMSPQAHAQYQACEEQIARFCRDYTQGDTERAIVCRHDARNDFAALSTDAQRAAFLAEKGCRR